MLLKIVLDDTFYRMTARVLKLSSRYILQPGGLKSPDISLLCRMKPKSHPHLSELVTWADLTTSEHLC